MELDENGFLEELLSLKNTWEHSGMTDIFPFQSPPPQQPPPPPPPPPFQTTITLPSSSSSLSGAVRRNPLSRPSKNLMAERRRRKRLHDRFSMLRSVVPKITKMDRTSILSDAIDYAKELIERVQLLHLEIQRIDQHHPNIPTLPMESNQTGFFVANTPVFNVERKEKETLVEICCSSSRPELLISTVGTIEALGLEINHCVVSCFNGFGLQASCNEGVEQRKVITAEEIKEALFQNACY